MNNEDQIYILTIIKNNGDILPLITKYDYSTIANQISDYMSKNLICEENGNLIVTSNGTEHRNELSASFSTNNGFILPQIQYKRQTIDEKYIYLPQEHKIKS